MVGQSAEWPLSALIDTDPVQTVTYGVRIRDKNSRKEIREKNFEKASKLAESGGARSENAGIHKREANEAEERKEKSKLFDSKSRKESKEKKKRVGAT